jgi:hypothetical protein
MDYSTIALALGMTNLLMAFSFLWARRSDGEFMIHTDDAGKKTFVLSLDGDPEELIGRKRITFKITDEI